VVGNKKMKARIDFLNC